MRLIQFETHDGDRRVAVSDGANNYLRVVSSTQRIYELAVEATRTGVSLETLVLDRIEDQRVSYEQLLADQLILPPIDHPDPAHCLVTGTGLSHLGSAQARNEMHTKLKGADANLTDSMKMFKLGLDGGKPESGKLASNPNGFGRVMVRL